jgi:hypothetical protein
MYIYIRPAKIYGVDTPERLSTDDGELCSNTNTQHLQEISGRQRQQQRKSVLTNTHTAHAQQVE